MEEFSGSVPEWLNEDYITDCLQEYYKEPELEVSDINMEPGSAFGDNFTCQIIRITVNVANSSFIEGSLHLIAKVQPPSVLTQNLCEHLDITRNEANFYSVVLPKFIELTAENPRYQELFPKCYKVDAENCTLVLEDLKERGLLLENRGKPLDLAQAELVMDALAVHHGLSLRVLEDNLDMKEKFDDCLWGRKGEACFTTIMHNAAKSFEINMELFEAEFPEKYVEKLKLIEEDFVTVVNASDPNEDNINVLNHGDAWRNNMLFHYTDEVADDIVLLDFQMFHYGNFANDLQYFMFTSLPAEIILTHLDHLLEKYYTKLSEVAPDVPDLTLERIKSEFENKYLLGYQMAVTFRAITLYEAIDINVLFKGDTINDTPYKREEYISDLKQFLPFFENAGLF